MEVGNTAVARDALTNAPGAAESLAPRAQVSPIGLIRPAAPTEAPSRVYKEALARLFKTLDSGLILAAILAAGSYLAFIVLLKLQIPVWPTFISG